MPDIIAKPDDDFSHNHFELNESILASKLTILEFFFSMIPNFFFKLYFFITKLSDILAEPNDNFSHGHFELKNFILAQKLTILEGGLHR